MRSCRHSASSTRAGNGFFCSTSGTISKNDTGVPVQQISWIIFLRLSFDAPTHTRRYYDTQQTHVPQHEVMSTAQPTACDCSCPNVTYNPRRNTHNWQTVRTVVRIHTVVSHRAVRWVSIDVLPLLTGLRAPTKFSQVTPTQFWGASRYGGRKTHYGIHGTLQSL